MEMERVHYSLRELGSRSKGMTTEPPLTGRILIVGEEGGKFGEPLAQVLPGCRFTLEACPDAARKFLLSYPVDLVLLHHSDSIQCLDLLPIYKALRPSVAIVVITGCGSEDLAVQAFRYGAIDYFRKPFEIGELELTVRAVLEIQKKSKTRQAPPPAGGLQRALRYIEVNLQTRITLDRAAREAGMSVSCFERHLKQVTGKTFVAYLNLLRIAKARALLQTGSTPMLQVAVACGFSNQSHFNRVFRKIAGVTPGAYRRSVAAGAGES
jgi:AraC-like DNA-binding protein